MSQEYATEELGQQYVQAMGSELGQLFYLLWNECAWLHWKWDDYMILFGTKPERIDLLNAAAPAFFKLVQDSMWEDVLLHICLLTDSPKSAGRDNLTLKRLPPLVAPAVRPEVERLLTMALQKAAFARDWRNRHIAHRDLGLALKETTAPLAPASRKNAREALEAIAALLNAVEHEYRDTTVAYDMVAPLGNAEVLLRALRDGLEARDARERRLKSGQLLPEDLVPWRAV